MKIRLTFSLVSLPTMQPIAKFVHKNTIPVHAKPYPGVLKVIRGNETNTTLTGMAAGTVAAGIAFVVLRPFLFSSIIRSMRTKYTYIPGTQTPRRITTLTGFLYDITPEITSYALNAAAAVPFFFAAKLYVEGEGRFKGWENNYNPYASSH